MACDMTELEDTMFLYHITQDPTYGARAQSLARRETPREVVSESLSKVNSYLESNGLFDLTDADRMVARRVNGMNEYTVDPNMG